MLGGKKRYYGFRLLKEPSVIQERIKDMTKRKTAPTKESIWEHHKDNIPTESPEQCMACYEESGRIEKAHLIAHAEGGSNEPDNYVLLCPTCHKHQEFLSSIFAATGQPIDGGNLRLFLQIAANDTLMAWYRRNNNGHLLPRAANLDFVPQEPYARFYIKK